MVCGDPFENRPHSDCSSAGKVIAWEVVSVYKGVRRARVSRCEEETMPRGTSILRFLNIGVVLFCLPGAHSVAVAQQGSNEEAKSLNQQVVDLYQQGRYEEAIARAERALAIQEKALGPENQATASLLNNLAVLYHATGAYGQAEPLYKRVLAIYGKALGPEHPDTAMALNNLA
ncbi:MAG: tetratricopeptide repeat protein, partial [Nitrospira sp. LK70]|nr:tetratricopeptide repeat protein [Nitrospira sp. LK70]